MWNAHFGRPVLKSGTRTNGQNKGLGRMAGGGGRRDEGGGMRRREEGLGTIIDERG